LIGKDIPLTAIDGIEPAELDFEPRGKRRSRRPARSAQRQPSRRQQARGNGFAGEAAPSEDRPSRQNRRPAAAKAPRPDLADSNVTMFPRAAAARSPRQPERKPEPERQVVGFGDRLPAFLARPPRIVARP
jgi:hypothetical protein